MIAVDAENNPKVMLLHRPSKQVSLLGAVTAAPRSTEYIMSGDVIGVQAPQVVYFPEDAFELTENVRVPSYQLLQTSFAGDPDLNFMGPFPDETVGTEVVETRCFMYLPITLAPTALAHAPMTPRKAWELLAVPILSGPDAAALQEHYKPLLNWLRVGCTKYTMNHDSPITTHDQVVTPFPQPHGLPTHISNILERELPGWNKTPPTGNAAVAQAVNNLATQIRDTEVLQDVQQIGNSEKSRFQLH